MEQSKKNLLLRDVIINFGLINQIKMVYEEMGELLQALNKLDRLTPKGQDFGTWPTKDHSIQYCLAYWNVCSEIADLGIMNDQLKIIFHPEAIKLSEDRKLVRLDDRLQKFLECKRLKEEERKELAKYRYEDDED